MTKFNPYCNSVDSKYSYPYLTYFASKKIDVQRG